MEYKNLTNYKNVSDSTQSSTDRIDNFLLDNHIHFINGELDENSVKDAIKWLVYENLNKNEDKILTMYINSCGGSLTDTFALVDIMRNSQYIIRTVGVGNLMSAAFILFSCGTKGHRYIYKNTSIMCHQFAESIDNTKYHDIRAQMRETENCNNRMIEILRDTTNLPVSKIKSKLLSPTDFYMTAEELVSFNVADRIL
jgi:ATP-dependent Clp protease protease subunit